jgi:hypothetical protein
MQLANQSSAEAETLEEGLLYIARGAVKISASFEALLALKP